MKATIAERSIDRGRLLTAKAITGVFGAEVTGADFSRKWDASLIEEVEQLIHEHKVLVFRDQHGIGPTDLARVASYFGTPETAPHPELPDYPGTPEVKVITKDGSYQQDTWHTDGATREDTRWLSFLQAIDIPPQGRDTLFADMDAVFEGLSPKLQDFLSGLTALQSWGIQRPDAPPVPHPAVIESPVTGRKTLYVNQGYTRALEGLAPGESDLLLGYLMRRVYIPEYHVRVVWRPGTITVWDNQRTQHYIVQDSRYLRTMHRVMVQPSRH